MKALEILKVIGKEKLFQEFIGKNEGNLTKVINEAIKELEELENKSCNGCRHLKQKEENLNHDCLIEVCKSCTRSNIDKWEQK